MSGGFGSLPSFAQNDSSDLSPALLQALQAQASGAGGGAMQAADAVPPATPPGFTGYAPQTPPTGAPTPVVQPGAAAAGAGILSMMGPNSAEAATAPMSDRDALIASAKRIGADPLDLATVMSYETGGTFSPSITNPSGHTGLIQFGRNEQRAYGASPSQSFQEQLPAVERYLTDRGFQPGMSRLDLYSTINAGRPGLYGASDAGNGGAPGNVADKVASMAPHEAKAAAFLGGSFTSRMQTGGQPQSMSPGIAAPMGASMGSTAQQGGFGLGGVVGQGAAVPGQASAAPDVAALSGQLTALDGAPATQDGGGSYAGIMQALQGAAGGQQKQMQGQGQQRDKDKGPKFLETQPIGLQQARRLFDANRFYSMLPAGRRAG